ncbi:MAG: hypothetical protein FJZ01_22910 [Candidatus Sericytochromatia bacterium]|nr:hypothetical protein [Candidatus Tanganyikabacteria bacterium]
MRLHAIEVRTPASSTKPGANLRLAVLWFTDPVTVKIGQAEEATKWTIPIDTFGFADGSYTMVTIVQPESGKKRPLGSAEVEIDNSFANHCK